MKHLAFIIFTLLATPMLTLAQPSADWSYEWTNTDFSQTSISFDEVLEGGPPKDGIPAIDNPTFKSQALIHNIGPREPVINLVINGDARAYPIRVLMYHEIVNDVVGGKPLSVTFCPLCNTSIVFDRTIDGVVHDFGTTGKLRKSDMIMYDRQTESWWQQFTGKGIVGHYTGTRLGRIPSRIESFERFKERHPNGRILVPNDPYAMPYGTNPYTNYDSERVPFLYNTSHNGPVPPMARVVAIGDDAWPLTLLQDKGEINFEAYRISWQAGQNSALDTHEIADGRDVGNVTVVRITDAGEVDDVIYHIPFAFAFEAFSPDGVIHTE